MRPAACLYAMLLLLLPGAPAWGHGDEDHGHGAAPAASAPLQGEAPQRRADGSLHVPKPVQHRLGLRTQPVEITQQAATVEFNARVIPDPNAGGRVQASQSGRLEPGPRGMPGLGQRVRQGEVLVWLRPAVGSIERANQQALLAEIVAQIELAEGRLARYAQLEGAIPGKEVEAVRIELAALRKRRAAVSAGLNAAEALTAPVSGVISAAHGVAGQVVEARDPIYEIVDPDRLAVEALAYDATQALGITAASLVLPGGSLPLDFVGAGRQLREQALPLWFRLRAASKGLAVGQPVKVVARTAATLRGVVLPQAALSRDRSGQTVVWVKLGAELYTPRRVEYRPLDGERVVVTAGLDDGERVVIAGAGLLGQVR